MKLKAKWVKCSGYDEHHSQRDFCSTCYPFWENVAVCFYCENKLTQTGYCRRCGKHFDLRRESDVL